MKKILNQYYLGHRINAGKYFPNLPYRPVFQPKPELVKQPL
jgi:hypothetical protein